MCRWVALGRQSIRALQKHMQELSYNMLKAKSTYQSPARYAKHNDLAAIHFSTSYCFNTSTIFATSTARFFTASLATLFDAAFSARLTSANQSPCNCSTAETSQSMQISDTDIQSMPLGDRVGFTRSRAAPVANENVASAALSMHQAYLSQADVREASVEIGSFSQTEPKRCGPVKHTSRQ